MSLSALYLSVFVYLRSIKDDHLPPLKWELAVVEDVHPGTEGHVSVVSVRTDQGSVMKKPVVKICPLPPADITD